MPDPIPSIQTSIIPYNSTIVVGLSGGPDSIYLLYQLKLIAQQYNLTLIAAHLDHEWQASSKIAARLCQQTCDRLQIKIVITTISQLAVQSKYNGSQEELGRMMRRHFFTTIAHQYQASAIALAHHLQDQHETFFIRLLRGSSLTGLTGIQQVDGLYIRPILHCKKLDILNYLQENGISYYTDPTNEHDTYLRNRIRNNVIPVLQKTDARFDKNLTSTMEHLASVDDFLEQHVQGILQTHLTDHGLHINLFLSLHDVIQQRILLTMMIKQKISFTPSQNLFKEIMRFLKKSSRTMHTIHASWMVEKNHSFFSVQKIKKSDKTL